MRIDDIIVGERHRKDLGDIGSLAKSIEELGLLQPIVVRPDNTLVAGFRRLNAVRMLGWAEVPVVVAYNLDDEVRMLLAERDENTCRLELAPTEMYEIGRAIEEREREGAKRAQLAGLKQYKQYTDRSGKFPERESGDTRDKVGKAFGIDGTTYEKIKGVVEAAKQEPDKFSDLPELMDKTRKVDGAYNELKRRKRKAEVETLSEEIKANNYQPPSGKYDVIVIDPPWPYGTAYNPAGRRAASPYPEMSLDEIRAINLPAADNCVLWLWTTHKFMRESFGILDAWGFRDVAILTWVKDRMGLGSWLRSQSEFCIMAVRGHPTVNLTNQTTVIYGEMREHSRKPDEFYSMVESLCSGYKIDWFSREKREGWEQFGAEAERF